MGCCFGHKKKMESTNITNFKINEKINPINILYVEDSDIYFSLMEYLLGKHIKTNRTITLTHSKTIQESYEKILNNNYDVIFIDRQLDNGEMGDDLIDKILHEQLISSEKIIIISSMKDLKQIQKYLDMGVHYFCKPLKVDQFIITIGQIF